MGVSNRNLRRIYRSYVSGRIRTDWGECPPVKDLRAAFEGTTRRAAKDAIVDHISGCSDCAREFEFIRKVREKENDFAAGMQTRSRGRGPSLFLSRPIREYALGAVMIAVVITAAIVSLHERSRDGERNKPAGIPETLAPSGRVESPPPLIFRWNPVPRAVSYVVEIYDESFRLIWESPPVSTTAALLPDPIKEAISDDKIYYWSVMAFDSEGKFGESRFEVFSVDR